MQGELPSLGEDATSGGQESQCYGMRGSTP